MRPDFQLSGTSKETEFEGAACHPVGNCGTLGATVRSVNIAGQMVNGHALTTVNVRALVVCASPATRENASAISEKAIFCLERVSFEVFRTAKRESCGKFVL